jgi:Protein of unknown function (DUF998)
MFGVGLTVAGLFVPDPAWSFPPGAPEGVPDRLSFNAAMHGVGFMVAFLAVSLACVVFARRSPSHGDRAAAAYAVATAVVAFGLAAWPGTDGASFRYLTASVIVWTWTVTLARSILLLRTANR